MNNGAHNIPAADATKAVEQTLTVLNFSSLQMETKHVKSVAFELLELRPMLTALAGKKAELRLSVDRCPDGAVAISPIGLTKVLINLVRNSAEAISARGQIVVAADGVLEEEGRRSIVISVEDNGLAIPLSLLEKIFDSEAPLELSPDAGSPRVRVRSRRLGLRIVRELVEEAGGRIRAIRLPERGSRFEVTLPVVGAQGLSAGPERPTSKLQNAVA